ncbi:MAG: hypothetical protein LQ351_005327 [Letrouitia transgressa]|nr:MAG: hypothetical protein LQ351_005327 [Letrouitia transgressa]
MTPKHLQGNERDGDFKDNANLKHSPPIEKTSNGKTKREGKRQGKESDVNKQANGQTGRSRHTACSVCRERKIRCDGIQPNCSRCVRLGHQCSYMVARRNDSGNKHQFSQALETLDARLAQAEARLATQHMNDSTMAQMAWPSFDLDLISSLQDTEISRNLSSNELNRQGSLSDTNSITKTTESSPSRKRRATESSTAYTTNVNTPLLPLSTFDIDGLISQDTSNELYAVWLHAASVSDKHVHLVDKCYNNARKYLEKAESEDHMGTFISIDALQACILIALFEFKQVYFARGWMSIGRAMRLAQMLGLHKMDRESTKIETGFQPGLLPTNDPVELEERRRTFWTLYNVEWYASSRTRSPMNIDDTEITTFLPSGGSFDTETAIATTTSLKEAMKQPAKACYTPFAGAVIMAAFTGRCLRHLQRSHKTEIDPDFSYDFWTQHYSIDQAIVQTFVSTLGHLNIPNAINNINGTSDPNVLFLNMNMHTTVICLHQAAAMQAEKSGLPATVVMESEHRITTAAQQVANIMRLTQNSVHLVKVRTLHVLGRV